jgi:nitroimidazol reductase NimA-like FMN-containing flavoprotein (pyridoxamine 5'-phosphate oxidase superfamily)
LDGEVTTNPVTRLTDDQCWALLDRERFGRLATNALGVMDITPINYVTDNRTLLIRTAPGSKLLELTVNSDVAFEIDERAPGYAWSVVLKGRARMITDAHEIALAERAGLQTQIATEKTIWVRIEPTQVSGRHFVLSA